MELLPQKIPTSTLILKDEKQNKEKRKAHRLQSQDTGFDALYAGSAFSPEANRMRSGDKVTEIVRLIKKAASQEVSDEINEEPPALTVTHLKVEGVCVMQGEGIEIATYRLTNTSDDIKEIVENAFSGHAVLAIAVESRHLKPNESTRLFIARSSHP